MLRGSAANPSQRLGLYGRGAKLQVRTELEHVEFDGRNLHAKVSIPFGTGLVQCTAVSETQAVQAKAAPGLQLSIAAHEIPHPAKV